MSCCRSLGSFCVTSSCLARHSGPYNPPPRIDTRGGCSCSRPPDPGPAGSPTPLACLTGLNRPQHLFFPAPAGPMWAWRNFNRPLEVHPTCPPYPAHTANGHHARVGANPAIIAATGARSAMGANIGWRACPSQNQTSRSWPLPWPTAQLKPGT